MFQSKPVVQTSNFGGAEGTSFHENEAATDFPNSHLGLTIAPVHRIKQIDICVGIHPKLAISEEIIKTRKEKLDALWTKPKTKTKRFEPYICAGWAIHSISTTYSERVHQGYQARLRSVLRNSVVLNDNEIVSQISGFVGSYPLQSEPPYPVAARDFDTQSGVAGLDGRGVELHHMDGWKTTVQVGVFSAFYSFYNFLSIVSSPYMHAPILRLI
ncbi:hypothetical protein B0H14DRAFT_2640144 [Mycena olivaceomarginata]|nr:hypothetical protein B0H14DRAFT_2640144 [Mycena olivaceomarginata]